MKTIKEILESTPESRILDIFIGMLGEKNGKIFYETVKNNPEYKKIYEKMLKEEIEHQNRIDRFKTAKEKIEKEKRSFFDWLFSWFKK